MPNPFSLAPGPPRGRVRRLVQSMPARHHWDLLLVVLIFSTPTGLWHICADSSRLPPSVPPLTLSGVSLESWVSLLGVFFHELVAWWDAARGLLVPGSGSSGFSALYWQASNSLQSEPAAQHLTLASQFSLQHPHSYGMSLSLWPMKVAKRIYVLNITR